MLNRIVWNRTDYLHKNGLGVKWPTNLIHHKNQPTNQPTTVSSYLFNSITIVLLFKDGFGIKKHTKFDMSINKGTKLDNIIKQWY